MIKTRLSVCSPVRSTVPLFAKIAGSFRDPACPALLLGLLVYAACPAKVSAQPAEIKTATYVKVQAVASKPEDAGVQKVTVTLEIDKDYFLTGNQVPEGLEHSRCRVSFRIAGKAINAELVYPPGKLENDIGIENYTIYEGTVTITGTIRRAIGDTSPIEAIVRMRGLPQHRRH